MKITPVELAERIEAWQHRLAPLGVDHWRIDKVIYGDSGASPDGGPANASAIVGSHYNSVTFYFNSDYVEMSTPRQLDETIVHEWLHVFGRDIDEFQARVESWMPDQTFEDYKDGFHHYREGEVESLARLIVSLYYAPARGDAKLQLLFRTAQ